jgi:hypothetical protein
MNWFIYRDDVFTPVNIKATTIEEAVRAGLTIAKEILGAISKYCVWEGDGDILLEFWHDKELSVKLIYSSDPARTLLRFYEGEKSGTVKCRKAEG